MREEATALGARRSALGTDGGLIARVGCVLRTVLGAPDYARYVAHRRVMHPGEPVMAEREFLRERERARYERPGARCC